MDLAFIRTITDPEILIQTLGIIGIFAIVFLETGAFFGFFLPGDSLLFTAGFLASQGLFSSNIYLSLIILLVGTFVMAVIGDSVGYIFGKRVGPSIFSKEDSLFFNKKHIIRAEEFYKKYGKKTIILARFVPIVRTFAPIVAGIGKMEYKTFITYNVIGAFVWTWGMILLGFLLGSIIPNPDKYIFPIIILIIVVSFLPAVYEIYKGAMKK